jgi:xylan 1,4-beta-xylosidase
MKSKVGKKRNTFLKILQMVCAGKYVFLFVFSTFTLNSFSQTIPSTDDSAGIYLADPTITADSKIFYLYGTAGRGALGGFPVYFSKNLKSWKLSDINNGYALMKGSSFGDRGFWAPQVFFYKSKWRMAYVANENIAIAESNSPAGPFTQTVKQALQATVRQIDPFVFIDDDDKVYLYHVRLEGGNKIFVAEMNDDLSAIKPETLKECISASEPWENTANAAWPVAEGPSILKHKGIYYLFYTANDFRNPDYAVGYATSNSPLGPWTKYQGNPILSKNLLRINGTGHGDFFTSKKVLYYVFHTHNSASKVLPRKTAVISMRFKDQKNGPPQLEVDRRSFRYLTK